jgi:hypothetical protein
MSELEIYIHDFCKKVKATLGNPISVRLIKMSYSHQVMTSTDNLFWYSVELDSIITVDTKNACLLIGPKNSFHFDLSNSKLMTDSNTIIRIISEISYAAQQSVANIDHITLDSQTDMRRDLLCAMAIDILSDPQTYQDLPDGSYYDMDLGLLVWVGLDGSLYRFDPKNSNVSISIDGDRGPFNEMVSDDFETIFISIISHFIPQSPFFGVSGLNDTD